MIVPIPPVTAKGKEKEGARLQKIIVTGLPEDVELLRACLGMLFPECEVQVISRKARDPGRGPAAPKLARSK